LTRGYDTCGQCLGCRKKRSTWTWQCCELDALFSAAVNLATSTATILLSRRVITIHPCFITGYDIGDEVWVSLACCLSSLQIETRWAFWSSLSSLGTNLAVMRLMFKLSTKMCWTVPCDSPAISLTSWIVCLRSARIASRTFVMFSGVVLVDGRPERSLSSTDVCPSLYHKKKGLLWLMALSPKYNNV
jgi:hypothetical protein